MVEMSYACLEKHRGVVGSGPLLFMMTMEHVHASHENLKDNAKTKSLATKHPPTQAVYGAQLVCL